MIIREVNVNKKQFISLLLLADEQENMIDRYLEKGTMYVLEDGNVKAVMMDYDREKDRIRLSPGGEYKIGRAHV